MKHQILIASYRKDFPWLAIALRSIAKFGSGFLPPTVVVIEEEVQDAKDIVRMWKSNATVQSHEGVGNLGAQIVMMKGDIYCPEADVVHLWGSDCMASAKFSPRQFMHKGKPVMPFASWAWTEANHKSAVSWRQGIVETLRFDAPNEYMRRIPLLYPKPLFKAVRDYIEKIHERTFESHVYWTGEYGTKHFSESNIMGAYAEKFMPDIYHWVASQKVYPEFAGDEVLIRGGEYPIVQFWSHGGMFLPMDTPYFTKHGSTLGVRPIDVINSVL